MAGLEIAITVGGDSVNVAALVAEDSGNWFVKHSAGACAPCRANEDPGQVPFPGCNSNFKRGGNGCKCTVEFDEDEG